MANPAGAPGGMRSFLQAVSKVTEEAPIPEPSRLEGYLITNQISSYCNHINGQDWQSGGEHCEPSDATHADTAKFVWDCLNQDDDELLGLLGNQTPLRDCRDFFADIGVDIICKETLDPEESRESKRRRLDYPSESSQSEVATQEAASGSALVTSEVTDISLLCSDEPQSLSYDMQHNSTDSDPMNSLSYGAPCMPEDNHLENCSDTNPMYFRPAQTPSSQESVTYFDDQTAVSGSSDVVPVTESLIMQETMKLSHKVSKGGRSLSKTKQAITTSIAHPFTLLKPSWDETDVTLNDINRRIRAPPKKPSEILGTSAFSGKLVIGKTRIRTDGGKGSITILRTKG